MVVSQDARHITLIRPDDWHVHFRDGAVLDNVVPATARRFGRAIVMPNLVPPVRTVEEAGAYRDRILRKLPKDSDFEPLMTLYLTDSTSTADIEAAANSGLVRAVKLYPAGATTNSDSGVTDLDGRDAVLTAMAQAGLPLLIHGEVVGAEVDVFDREKAFIDEVLGALVERHSTLKVVFEHITTADAVEFVSMASAQVGATITAHHLLMNRNAIFAGGLNPHHYCLPVLKREKHRVALVEAATGGDPKFFLGTDSAPHAKSAKENACGCAGMYTAHAALELYAESFDEAGALDRLEAFASLHGPAFYGMAPNEDQVSLERQTWRVPDTYRFADEELVPFRAGADIGWRLCDE